MLSAEHSPSTILYFCFHHCTHTMIILFSHTKRLSIQQLPQTIRRTAFFLIRAMHLRSFSRYASLRRRTLRIIPTWGKAEPSHLFLNLHCHARIGTGTATGGTLPAIEGQFNMEIDSDISALERTGSIGHLPVTHVTPYQSREIHIHQPELAFYHRLKKHFSGATKLMRCATYLQFRGTQFTHITKRC
jgi:hypothetical protein